MATTVLTRPRWRFTIGSLMIGIAAIAGVLALPGVAGLLAGMLFIVSLILLGARWLVEGGTRNRPLAAGTFWAVALCINLVSVVCCLSPDNLILGTVFLGMLFIGLPAIVAVGIAWVQLMDRQGAILPRSPEAGGVLVFILAVLPIFTLGTLWPLHLAFFATRPAFDHLANQIAAGKTVVFPQYAGWFKLNGAAVDPVSGAVGLLTEPDTRHPAGFVRILPGSTVSPNTPVHGSDLRIELVGKWSYRQDD